MSIIILYGIILWRGFRISIEAPGRFESLLSFGLTVSMGIQDLHWSQGYPWVCFRLKDWLCLFKLYGGALFMNMITIGILMNIKASNGIKE